MEHTKVLNNGVAIPYVGLGVFRMTEDDGQTEQAVRWALEAGYRHIDTAAAYNNETGVGKAIRESGVARKDIFLTTKLWNGSQREGNQREAFEKSLERLDTDYVDLYLIHWPVKEKFCESWKIMEELYEQGRIRAIGVSNFLEHHLEELLKVAKIVPAVNQVECHPYLSQEPLVKKCEQLGIAFEAWSPIGGGKNDLPSHPELIAIGKQYGKSAVQVMLRWEVQRGIITIPKSVNRERIAQNIDIFDFELSEQDMQRIAALNRDERVGSHPDTFTF